MFLLPIEFKSCSLGEVEQVKYVFRKTEKPKLYKIFKVGTILLQIFKINLKNFFLEYKMWAGTKSIQSNFGGIFLFVGFTWKIH